MKNVPPELAGDTVVRIAVTKLRAWLRKTLLEGGVTRCPICDRHAQMYRRKISSSMSFVLLQMIRFQVKDEWVHVATLLSSIQSIPPGIRASYIKTDWTKMQFWGLIEEHSSCEKGSGGHWRPTEKGKRFARGLISVPRYAFVINNEVVYWSEEKIDIFHSINDKFNYEELTVGFPWREHENLS